MCEIAIIITGLCGSGKTTYCNNIKAPYLSFDEMFNYNTKTIDIKKIDEFLNTHNTSRILYFDAYNEELLIYVSNKYNNIKFEFIILYTKLDTYYDTIAIDSMRDFITDVNIDYNSYINIMKAAIQDIIVQVEKFVKFNTNASIKYIYRNNSEYITCDDNTKLLNELQMDNKTRLLKYIDETSNHCTYQSIILNNEYIRRGTEQDWLSFDNILKCTSLKNKIICDTGCFNGYFSFRCIDEGAQKVIGIDHNIAAINICKRLCIYNEYHKWKCGIKKDTSSCKLGIDFYLRKIGKDNIFDDIISPPIDIIFALNYLHHLKNEYGDNIFMQVLDDFFKHSKEIIFEVNESEIEYIEQKSNINKFYLNNKIESHRKTSFGNRWILHYKSS